MSERDERQALYAHELPREVVKALKIAEPPAASKAFNCEVNRKKRQK